MSNHHPVTHDLDGRDPVPVDHQDPPDTDALTTNRCDDSGPSLRHRQESNRLADDRCAPSLLPTDAMATSATPETVSDSPWFPGMKPPAPPVVQGVAAGSLVSATPDGPTPTSTNLSATRDEVPKSPQATGPDVEVDPAASAVQHESFGREGPRSASSKERKDMDAHGPASSSDGIPRASASATTSLPTDTEVIKSEGEGGDPQHAVEDATSQLQPPFWSPTPPSEDCNFLVDYDSVEVQQPHMQYLQPQSVANGAGHFAATPSTSTNNRLSLLDMEANGGNNTGQMLPKISLPLPSSNLYSAGFQQAPQVGSSLVAPANWHPLAFPAHQQEQFYARHQPQAGYFDSLSAQLSDVASQSHMMNRHHGPSVTITSRESGARLPHAQAQHLSHTQHSHATAEKAFETMSTVNRVGGRGRPSGASYNQLKSSITNDHYSGAAGAAPGYAPPPFGPGHYNCSCNVAGCSVDMALRGPNALLPPIEGSSVDSAVVRYGPWSAPSTPSGFSHPNLYHRPPKEVTMSQALVPHRATTVAAPYGVDGSIDGGGGGATAHRYYNQNNGTDYRFTRAGGDSNNGAPSSSRNALTVQGHFFNSGPSDYAGYGHDNPFMYRGHPDFHTSIVSPTRGRVGDDQVRTKPSAMSSSAMVPGSLSVARPKLDSVNAVTVYASSRPRYVIDDGTYRDPEPKHCTNCMTMSTPSWRRCPEGRRLLCNACGLFEKLHGRPRPTYHAKDGSIKIQRSGPPHDPCTRCDRRDSPQWFRTPNKELICNACNEMAKQQRTMTASSILQSPPLITSASASSNQQVQNTGSKPNKSASSKRKRKSTSSAGVSNGSSTGAAAQATVVGTPLRLPSASSLASSSLLPPTATIFISSSEMGIPSSDNGRAIAWPANMYRGGAPGFGATYDQPYAYGPSSTSTALAYSNAAAAAAAAAAYAYQAHYPCLPNTMAAAAAAAAAGATPTSSTAESSSLIEWQGAAGGGGGAFSSSLPSRLQDQASEFNIYTDSSQPSLYAPMANVSGDHPTTTMSSHLGIMRATMLAPGFPSSISPSIPQSSHSGGAIVSAPDHLRHDDGISPSAVVSGAGSDAHGPEGQPEGSSDTTPTAAGPSSSSTSVAQSSAPCGSSVHSEVRVKTEGTDKGNHNALTKRGSNQQKRKASSHDEALSSSSTSTLKTSRSKHVTKKTRASSHHNLATMATVATHQAAATAAARSDRYHRTSSSARTAATTVVSGPEKMQQKSLPTQHHQQHLPRPSQTARSKAQEKGGWMVLSADARRETGQSKDKGEGDRASKGSRAAGGETDGHDPKRRRLVQPAGPSTSGKTTLSWPSRVLDTGKNHHRRLNSESSTTSQSSCASSSSNSNSSSDSSSMGGDDDEADDEDEDDEEEEVAQGGVSSSSTGPRQPNMKGPPRGSHGFHHSSGRQGRTLLQERGNNRTQTDPRPSGIVLRIPKEVAGSGSGSTSSSMLAVADKSSRSTK
ncbi:hypothetical protein DFQ26_009435 [Actinomortierella ambigua]|nr:hypothetical protein DFQ26_009435 [Actinomortierella ambigua]